MLELTELEAETLHDEDCDDCDPLRGVLGCHILVSDRGVRKCQQNGQGDMDQELVPLVYLQRTIEDRGALNGYLFRWLAINFEFGALLLNISLFLVFL
jgi:hypothetical protein